MMTIIGIISLGGLILLGMFSYFMVQKSIDTTNIDSQIELAKKEGESYPGFQEVLEKHLKQTEDVSKKWTNIQTWKLFFIGAFSEAQIQRDLQKTYLNYTKAIHDAWREYQSQQSH